MLSRLLLAAAIVLTAPAALAANLPITAFVGVWQGSAVSESNISVNFALTSRDIGVELRTAANGFTITWNTVQRKKGDPNNPEEVLKSTTMELVAVRPGVWQSRANADPISSGKPYAWAYIAGKSLILNSLQIYDDGRHETQVYRRTLSGTGMQLEFVRTVEGEPVRVARGRLIKVAK